MRLFSQSFSDSQDRLEAREKSILNDCYLDVIKYDIPLMFVSQNKPSMWKKAKKGN
jgi:hypothetical protein